MRNFTTRIQNKANALALRARMALSNQRGDFYISDAVKIIIAVVLGVWAVAFGALRLRDALRRRASGQPWGCCAGDAAVKFAVGIFMLASPLGSMAAWTVMVGLFFLFVGASVIFSAVYLDRLPHDFEDF